MAGEAGDYGLDLIQIFHLRQEVRRLNMRFAPRAYTLGAVATGSQCVNPPRAIVAKLNIIYGDFYPQIVRESIL